MIFERTLRGTDLSAQEIDLRLEVQSEATRRPTEAFLGHRISLEQICLSKSIMPRTNIYGCKIGPRKMEVEKTEVGHRAVAFSS